MKKEDNKNRQLKKKQVKKEREKIIQKYVKKTESLINDSFLELIELNDYINSKREKIAMEFLLLEDNIKNKTITVDDILTKVIELKYECETVYDAFNSDDIEENKAKQKMLKMMKGIEHILETAYVELDGNKNKEYILALITSRTHRMITECENYLLDNLDCDKYTEGIYSISDVKKRIVKIIDDIIEENKSNNVNKDTEERLKAIKYNNRTRIDYRNFKKFLSFKSFEFTRQNCTRHTIWKHKETGVTISLPDKSGTIPQGTILQILKQMGSTKQELIDFIHE